MTLPSQPLEPRLHHAREETIRALSQHFADDRLTVEELDVRLGRAYQCQSVAELDALIADLPKPAVVQPVLAPAQPVVHESWLQGAGQRILAILGGTMRRGPWAVPQRLDIIAVLGGVELDLREAQLSGPVTEIHVVAVMGGVHIQVPPTMRVEVQGTAILAGFADRASKGAVSDPMAPVVRITGVAVMAGVDVELTTVQVKRIAGAQ